MAVYGGFSRWRYGASKEQSGENGKQVNERAVIMGLKINEKKTKIISFNIMETLKVSILSSWVNK